MAPVGGIDVIWKPVRQPIVYNIQNRMTTRKDNNAPYSTVGKEYVMTKTPSAVFCEGRMPHFSVGSLRSCYKRLNQFTRTR